MTGFRRRTGFSTHTVLVNAGLPERSDYPISLLSPAPDETAVTNAAPLLVFSNQYYKTDFRNCQYIFYDPHNILWSKSHPVPHIVTDLQSFRLRCRHPEPRAAGFDQSGLFELPDLGRHGAALHPQIIRQRLTVIGDRKLRAAPALRLVEQKFH